jgi:hypothetical protein
VRAAPPPPICQDTTSWTIGFLLSVLGEGGRSSGSAKRWKRGADDEAAESSKKLPRVTRAHALRVMGWMAGGVLTVLLGTYVVMRVCRQARRARYKRLYVVADVGLRVGDWWQCRRERQRQRQRQITTETERQTRDREPRDREAARHETERERERETARERAGESAEDCHIIHRRRSPLI